MAPHKRKLAEVKSAEDRAEDSAEEQEQLESEEESEGPTQTPIVVPLSSRRIQSLWPLLHPHSYSRIQKILTQPLNPILHELNTSTSSQTQFQVLHRAALHSISKQLKRTPVPPRTRLSHLEPDILLRQNSKLEDVLVELHTSNAKLEREIEREQRDLERDEKALVTLEANSRKQLAQLRALNKKASHAIPTDDVADPQKELEINLDADAAGSLDDDDPLVNVLVGLGDSLEKLHAALPSTGLLKNLKDL
jgi:hypothetical protein